MKISYGRYMTNGGSCFTQRILLTEHEYNILEMKIKLEIFAGYPRFKEFSGLSSEFDIQRVFPYLEVVKMKENIFDKKTVKIVFLNTWHCRFIKKYIEGTERLKLNQNTYIQIED